MFSFISFCVAVFSAWPGKTPMSHTNLYILIVFKLWLLIRIILNCLKLGAWCLKLAACGLFLPGTSRSSGRKRDWDPAYRIWNNLTDCYVWILLWTSFFLSFKAALHWTMASSINIIAPNVGVFFCLRPRSSSCALTSIFLSFSSSVIYSFLNSSYSIPDPLSSLKLEAWSLKLFKNFSCTLESF